MLLEKRAEAPAPSAYQVPLAMTVLDVVPVPKSDVRAAKMKTLFFSFMALVPIYNYIYLFVFLSPSLSCKYKGEGTNVCFVQCTPSA